MKKKKEHKEELLWHALKYLKQLNIFAKLEKIQLIFEIQDIFLTVLIDILHFFAERWYFKKIVEFGMNKVKSIMLFNLLKKLMVPFISPLGFTITPALSAE